MKKAMIAFRERLVASGIPSYGIPEFPIRLTYNPMRIAPRADVRWFWCALSYHPALRLAGINAAFKAFGDDPLLYHALL